MAHKDTEEQLAIYAAYPTGGSLLIEAGAGCGKTTVVKGVAKRNKQDKFLYLAFNASVKDEARATFSKNAHCMTAAGLCFMPVTKALSHKLDREAKRMYMGDAARLMSINHGIKVGKVGDQDIMLGEKRLARLVLDTVTRFCYSADDAIERKHMPAINGADDDGYNEAWQFVYPLAKRAFKDFLHPDGKLGWNKSHDYAFKAFALSKPDLSHRYDTIMLDEAQDTNPVLSALIHEQSCQQIFVGDRCQSIYAWRGAQNAMAEFHADHHLLLSQSFRFGPAVAEEANKWLTVLDAPLRLTGFDQIDSQITDEEDSDAVLCRTNAQAMAEAMQIRENGQRYAVVGGTAEIESLAKAAADLQRGVPTDHPDLGGFKSWDQFRGFVMEDNSAADLKIFVQLVDGYGVPKILQLANEAVKEEYADVTISTAHKAKGREWKRVRIANDFREPEADPETGEVKLDPAELMLAYVSVTRAQEKLNPGPLNWIERFLPAPPRKLRDVIAERRAEREQKHAYDPN